MATSTSRNALQDALSDADFPANRDELIARAVGNDADEDTVRALRAIPLETYANFDEVVSSVTLTEDEGLPDDEKAAARRTHTKPGLSEQEKDTGPVNPIVEELGENRGS